MPEKPLSKKFLEDLGLIHIEVERLKKNKKWVYTYFIIYSIIGCTLLYVERNFLQDFDFTYSRYLKLLGSLLVLFLGLGLCGLAYRKLTLHIKRIKKVKSEKDRINLLLIEQQIDYSYNIEFGKKYHGKQDVTVELKSNSSLLKDSKITYQI